MDAEHNLISRLSPFSVVVFPLVALTFSWATSSVTESIGVANLALVLAIITVTAGFIRWDAGVVTSVVAATTLNFFHTEPVHSLRMTDSSDLLMISLLLIIGIGVSAVTASKVSKSVKIITAEVSTSQKSELINTLSSPIPFSRAWSAAMQAEAEELHHVDVSLVSEIHTGIPVISRRSPTIPTSDSDDKFVLPASGAIMKFSDPRLTNAVLFQPRQDIGSVRVSRKVVTAFVQQLELALH